MLLYSITTSIFEYSGNFYMGATLGTILSIGDGITWDFWRFWEKNWKQFHTKPQIFGDFFDFHGKPLSWVLHMDPREPWITFSMLLTVHPAEIQAPSTPGVSHGTKTIRQIFSQIIKIRCYFMHFGDLLYKKILRNGKTSNFSST